MKRPIASILILVAILGLGVLAQRLILGGTRVVYLNNSPVLAVAAQNLQPNSGYQLIEGKDYKIGATKYFDNAQWAVVSVVPVSASSDPALIVLRKVGDSYQKVLGPGNSFYGSDLSGLPADVTEYINPQ